MTNIIKTKIVGTTFHQLPKGKAFNHNGVIENADKTEMLVPCTIVPEPTNEYDPTAVAVKTELYDGSTFTVGYLAKNDPNKACITGPTKAQMTVTEFKQVGFNTSYQVSFESELD